MKRNVIFVWFKRDRFLSNVAHISYHCLTSLSPGDIITILIAQEEISSFLWSILVWHTSLNLLKSNFSPDVIIILHHCLTIDHDKKLCLEKNLFVKVKLVG